MPQQRALEGIDWKQTFRIPSADMSQAEQAVQPPFLLEAVGLDGRFKGSLRSFPGFRSLGISEAYDGSGPLIVGPGVDHCQDDNNAVLVWKHWPMRLSRKTYLTPEQRIRFFKWVEFKKSPSSSQTVSGFVMILPYEGPVYDGASSYNSGLPVTSQLHKHRVAFFYWDDEPFVHPHIAATERDPGWRVRILDMLNYRDGTGEPWGGGSLVTPSWVGGTASMDVASWGTCAYIVNPDLVGTGKSYWGTAYATNPTFDTNDGAVGPAVLYYDNTDKYVRVRQMGSNLRGFSGQTISGGQKIDSGNGMVYTTAIGLGMSFYVTLRNSATGRRCWPNAPAGCLTATSGNYLYYYYIFLIPIWAWDEGFDTVEFWRSPLGLQGLLFKEQQYSMPSSAPSYSSGVDGADSNYRRYLAVFAGNSTTPSDYTDLPHTTNRTTFVGVGLDDVSLVGQEPYGGVYSFDQAPPSDASRIVAHQQMTLAVSGKAENFDDYLTTYDGPVRAVVPSRLRWSSPVLPKPEDYSNLTALWSPDEEVGMIYGLGRAGNFTFAVGTRGTVALRRSGDRMVVSTVGDDVVPVSRFAWCVGANSLFVLTKSELLMVSGADTSVVPVEIVSRLLKDPLAWGNDLALDAQAVYPAIGMEYDEAGRCLIIRNLNRFEAAVLWLETGALTWLVDFPWMLSTSGSISSTLTGRPSGGHRRAFFVGEVGVAVGQDSSDTYPAYFDVFYPDFASDDPPSAINGYSVVRANTAHGSANFLSGDYPEADVWDGVILRGTIASMNDASGTTMSRVVVTMPKAQQAGSKLIDRMRRRFTGAILHLWDVTKTIHKRRMLYWFDVDGTTNARFWVYPVLSSQDKTDLANGSFALAPVVLRATTALFPTDDGETIGRRKTILAASLLMDVNEVRRYTQSSGAYVVFDTDASGTPMWFVGFTVLDDALSSETSYVGPSRAGVEVDCVAVLNQSAIGLKGRLEEATRTAFVPSRLEQDCAKSLAFSGSGVAVGVEGYLCGASIELRSLRVLGNIVPSARKGV